MDGNAFLMGVRDRNIDSDGGIGLVLGRKRQKSGSFPRGVVFVKLT